MLKKKKAEENVCESTGAKRRQLARKSPHLPLCERVLELKAHYVAVCFLSVHNCQKCHSSDTTIIKARAVYPKDHLVIFIKSIVDNSPVMLAPL